MHILTLTINSSTLHMYTLYINDINIAIKSQIRLFADDSVLYRNIRSQNDQVILQNDLDHFEE